MTAWISLILGLSGMVLGELAQFLEVLEEVSERRAGRVEKVPLE